MQLSRDNVYLWVLLGLVLIPVGLLSYKLLVLKFPVSGLLPAVSYQVEMIMEMQGHGDDISVRTFLPRTDSRQVISDEVNTSTQFNYTVSQDQLNRVITWSAEQVQGKAAIRYTFHAQAKHVQYQLPDKLPVPAVYPEALQPYLEEENGIQVNDPAIDALLQQLVPAADASIKERLFAIHDHLQHKLANKSFAGFTDALTALKLGEGSCNGKGRLFVALARKANIPARLVGGLILEAGSKRISHQWVEAYVNGHWVPFDTINDHKAELPANYLALYYGDEVLFKHTANVNFNYDFKMIKRMVPKAEAQEVLDASVLSSLNIYSVFEQIGISQNLLKILLMIPVGALVTVIFRNVIGVETFGTFLPALIAAAARETGLLWGLIGFVLIIMTAAVLRKVLDWLHLLHSPKMAIMLTIIVVMIVLMSLFSVKFGLLELAHISLFPIAILAITAERFAIIEAEQGLRKSLKITLATALVITACYVAMGSLFLQSMILAFPEVLLIIIALNLWLGKWIGMRVMEFVRFRALITKDAR
ncbi:MAG: UUP1 family membrane protein [Pseudomonadota bacterium]